MMEVVDFQTRGRIIKEEKIKSLTDRILNNTLVFENYEPFPGYFGINLPEADKPRSIFLVLSKEYDTLFLSRAMQQVGKERKHTCDGASCFIETRNHRYCCIRINNLSCFAEIPLIQEIFQKMGIEMMKYKAIDEDALILVDKTFVLKCIDNGIYSDLDDGMKFYFELPFELKWNDFKVITKNVKNNISNNIFDAAIGFVWLRAGLVDMIRIYDMHCDVQRVIEIRKKYYSEIERWKTEHQG